MHGFDQQRPTPLLTHCLTDPGQALRQRRCTHKRARPAMREEFVVRYQAMAMLDKIDEHLEDLGLNSHDCTRTAQLIALFIEDTLTEVINHCACPPPKLPAHRRFYHTPSGQVCPAPPRQRG